MFVRCLLLCLLVIEHRFSKVIVCAASSFVISSVHHCTIPTVCSSPSSTFSPFPPWCSLRYPSATLPVYHCSPFPLHPSSPPSRSSRFHPVRPLRVRVPPLS